MANLIWADEMHDGQRMWMEWEHQEDPGFSVLVPIVMIDVAKGTIWYDPKNVQESMYKPHFKGVYFWDRKPTEEEREPSYQAECGYDDSNTPDEWADEGRLHGRIIDF